MPNAPVDQFIVWMDGNEDDAKRDAITLKVFDAQQNLVAESANPLVVKRNDASAIAFSFPVIQSVEEQLFTFVLQNNADYDSRVFVPIDDHVKVGEAIPVAFELGKQKRILTQLFDVIYSQDLVGDDISFYLYRGQQIVDGKNPFDCTIDPEESCIGYPAHFPGMYWFAAGAVYLGVSDLPQWAAVWRPFLLASWAGIGVLVFLYLYRRGFYALSVASLGLWLFNRWSLYVLQVAHIDFLGVFFLIASVMLAGSWPLTAAFLLGVSLSIKQVALLIVPLFCIWVWRTHKLSIQKMVLIVLLIAAAPTIVSLPFLIDNHTAVFAGWFNVVERPAAAGIHGFTPSLVELLDITSWWKILPLAVLTLIVYVSVWRKSVSLMFGVLMVFAITIGFTHVLYNQYLVWFIPFIPLAVPEVVGTVSQKAKTQ